MHEHIQQLPTMGVHSMKAFWSLEAEKSLVVESGSGGSNQSLEICANRGVAYIGESPLSEATNCRLLLYALRLARVGTWRHALWEHLTALP